MHRIHAELWERRTIHRGMILVLGLLLFGSCLPKRELRSRPGPVLRDYAEVLGVPPSALKNQPLYSFIHEWMGVPHRDGGVRKSGIDCSAFTGLLLREVYGHDAPRTAAEMAEQVRRKYEGQLVEGDLVFFSFGKKRIDHVGVYLANGRFVHVSSSQGVVISKLRDPWYYQYFVRCGTLKGLRPQRISD